MEDTTEDSYTQSLEISEEIFLYDDQINETYTNFTETSSVSLFSSVPVYGALVITEFVMAAIVVLISVAATLKLTRWRRNYRNQMLMQLSIARLVGRVAFLSTFLQSAVEISSDIFLSLQIYSSHVIIILMAFFIRHMYNSLIVVVISVRRNNLYKVICCSWLIPIPISVLYCVLVAHDLARRWTFYLVICCVLKWPVIILGTILYIKILIKVIMDPKRNYIKSLTITTFFLCLVINLYTLSKDVIVLWLNENYITLLLNAVLGVMLDFFAGCLYIILLLKSRNKIPSPKTRSEETVL